MEPTEAELNSVGIYKGNPEWANKFNATRRLLKSLNENKTPPLREGKSKTCVPEREENSAMVSNDRETEHRDTSSLSDKSGVPPNAGTVSSGTKKPDDSFFNTGHLDRAERYIARKLIIEEKPKLEYYDVDCDQDPVMFKCDDGIWVTKESVDKLIEWYERRKE